MAVMRLASLTLAALDDPAALHDLVSMPESERLERKRSADARTLAKAISAFANTDGGWLLLGVDDDGSVHGWQPKGTSHARDWIRDVLDNELDPQPSFEADVFDLDGQSIGVVRVPRSSEAPHFINDTGEAFERRNGQTRRATADRVRALALRGGGQQRVEAVARLEQRDPSTDVAIALDAPREGTAMHARALASIVRVSLLEPGEELAIWAHQPTALQATDTFVATAAHTMNDRGHDWFERTHSQPARTTAHGHAAEAGWDGRILQQVVAAWDGRGLGGVRLAGSRPDDSGIYYLLSDEVRDRWLTTSLGYLLGCLAQAGGVGPAIARWDLYGIRTADVITVADPNVVAKRGSIPGHYNNMVAVDQDFDIAGTTAEELSDALWQQLERLAGAQATR